MVGVTGSNPVPPTTRESGTDNGAAFGFAPFVFPVTRTRRSAPWARRDSPGRHRAHGALLPQQRGILQAAELVAYAGGVFDVQVAGVLVHLLLQRLDPGQGLGGVHRRVIPGLQGDLSQHRAALVPQPLTRSQKRTEM